MKFWVYAIDWRSMAIEILGEYPNYKQATKATEQFTEGLTPDQLVDCVAYKTIGVTPVSPEMQSAVDQFKRFNGRVA